MGKYSECEYLYCGGFFRTTYRCTNNNDEIVSDDTYRKYCRDDSDRPTDDCPNYNTNGSICFITQACVKKLGKSFSDSCLELENLRSYRDSYLLSSEEGRKLVDEYYKTSPKIVKAINSTHNPNAAWDKIYSEYVIPAVNLVKLNRKEDALDAYKKMINALTEKYLGISKKCCICDI